jgi:Domain of unknown function (DUF4157)
MKKVRDKKSAFVQTAAGTPVQCSPAAAPQNDPLEREADAVADRVVHTTASVPQVSPLRLSASTAVHRSGSGIAPGAAPESVSSTLQTTGAPMDADTRGFMESRFGHDFSNVQIHTDTSAARSARDINARAYTAGSHIVFNDGEYAPGTTAGKHLLAHELTHVVQQEQGATIAAPVQTKADSEYTKAEAITYLQYALNRARFFLENNSKADAKAVTLMKRMVGVYNQLRQSTKADASDVTFNFDTSASANELRSGDAAKTIDELYGGFQPAAPPVKQADPSLVAENEVGETPGIVQAKAGLGGLTISPAYGHPVQRVAFVIPVIIILGGLLFTGCSRSSAPAGSFTCNDTQRTNLNTWRNTAKDWIDNATTKLSAVAGSTASATDRTMVLAALQANFRTQDTSNIPAIVTTLNRIKTKIETASLYNCRCGDNRGDAYTLGDSMYFCETFFTTSPLNRSITTIIHEAGHAVGLSPYVANPAGGSSDIYEHFSQYNTLPNAAMRTHTEPYAVLARQIQFNGGQPPGTYGARP